MLIPTPEKDDIMQFITEYLVKFPMTDEILENHKVRVIYDDGEADDTNNPQVFRQNLTFDIFVKSDVLHTASEDRLKDRAVMIFERIKYLLTRTDYVCNMRFRPYRDFGVGAKTIGYRRYRCVFTYYKTY